jgi:poly(3-hydroxybutyrate) depolymerase
MSQSVRIFALAAASFLAVTWIAMAQAPAPNAQDPKYQAKGEQDRTYMFPGNTEMISYHLYVPMKWDKNTKLPLVILTHGANQASTAPFMRPMTNPTLAKTAEERGYIVAAVTGYHANATGWNAATGETGWNNPYKLVAAQRGGGAGAGAAAGGGGRGGGTGGAGGGQGPAAAAGGAPAGAPAAGGGGGRGAGGGGGRGGGAAAAPATPEDLQRAEQDVLNVTDLMAKEYNVDTTRINLMGNSSGGGAVWAYTAKFPERWTAIAPSAAPLAEGDYPFEKLKNVPVIYIHGDGDTTMDYNAGKAMIDRAKARGVNATFLGVMGGQHTDAWAQPDIIKQIFDFFDAHKTKVK